MTLPTLSVVMPNYNHGRFLKESLGAILSQSQRPLEVIVVDDGSTDDSVRIIEELAQNDPIIRVVHNGENLGVIASMNRGLSLASGEYVHFAAADDRVLPGFYEKSLRLLKQYPQAGLCSALSLAMDEDGNDVFIPPSVSRLATAPCFIPPEKVLSLRRRPGPWISGYTVIHRCAVLVKEGGFRPELGPFADGFLDDVGAAMYGACFIPEPLVSARIMSTSYSGMMSDNTDVLRDSLERCAHLMSTEYARVFPRDYVRYFRRWSRFLAATMEHEKLRTAEQQYLVQLEHQLLSARLLDRVYLRVRRLGLQLIHYADLLYFYVRFRQLNRSIAAQKTAGLLRRLRT